MLHSPRPPPPEALLTGLVNDMAATPSPFILVLDDYHLIHTLAIHEQVGFLLEHGPPQMHLAILTREDPLLPLSRLRVRAQMSELRQADLRFTKQEAADFLRSMGLALSSADAAVLCERTEGWIAGLQLAALSLRDSDDVQRLARSFFGDQRYVMDYLFDEVFERQTEETQCFLLQTSILERLTAPLCDAVTGRTDSPGVLLELEHANLFLVPLDGSRQWYRYHRLFHDLLRAQCGASSVAGLHKRAARWYERNGMGEEALRHAVAAEDWDAVERVIEPAMSEAVRTGRFATVNRLLDAVPEARVRQSSALATVRLWTAMSSGQFGVADRYADLAEELLPADAPPADHGILAALRTYLTLSRFDVAGTISLAHRALELLSEEDPAFMRGAALTNLGRAQSMAGDLVAAIETYRQLLGLARQMGHVLSAVGAATSLAELLHVQGRRREAASICDRALTWCADDRGGLLPPAAFVYGMLGALCYEDNELGRALESVRQGLALEQQIGPGVGISTNTIVLAKIQQARGEPEVALATVAELRDFVSQFGVPQADAQVMAIEADIRLRQGDLLAAQRWAQGAGLSVQDAPNPEQEAAHLTYVRLLLAEGCQDKARLLLDRYEAFARQGLRARSLISVCVLQALAQRSASNDKQVRAYLGEALGLAAAEGYLRAFVDEGTGAAELLPAVRHINPAFVDQLLGAFGEGQDDRQVAFPVSSGHPVQALIEPLTSRELEVLALVVAGLSNREISDRLFVSIGTVKTHTHHIYGKLGVKSRPQAIARARELGLPQHHCHSTGIGGCRSPHNGDGCSVMRRHQGRPLSKLQVSRKAAKGTDLGSLSPHFFPHFENRTNQPLHLSADR